MNLKAFSLHSVKKSVSRAVGRAVDLDRRIVLRRGRYVICYHRVISEQQAAEEWVHHSMWISPETFERQISWMRSVGEIVPHERIIDYSFPNERPLFALTFDDGWRDNYESAWPIMRRHGATATIFLATSFLDDGSLIWPEDLTIKTKRAQALIPEGSLREKLCLLSPSPGGLNPKEAVRVTVESLIEQLKYVSGSEREGRIAAYYDGIGAEQQPLRGHMMGWSEAAELHRHGICMGSHTHTHQILSQSTEEDIEQELCISRERIFSRLGYKTEAFAYPNARYHGWEGRVIKRAGYRSAFRIHNLPLTPTADPYYLPRMISSESMGEADFFKLRLLGVY